LSQAGDLVWSGPPLCDEDENVYFLVIPPWTPHASQGASTAAPELLGPRDVLRISANGKERMTLSPAAISKFAGAKELTTVAMALERQGTLFMLVRARWGERGSEAERSGQYLVSFDHKGEYRSVLEVDWQEMVVDQFEVFGSGQFLLRGRRTHTSETRVAVLSAAGQTLEDVRGWAGYPSGPLEEPSPGSTPRFNHMVRGGDGRIYVAEQDALQDKAVVYAFGPSGESEELFKLRPMPRGPQLLGWKAAGDRFAAAYLEAEQQPEGSSSEDQRGRWWIAVYGNLANGGELQTIYGPAPGPPLCYQHKESEDRFTFLIDGAKFVRMSSP